MSEDAQGHGHEVLIIKRHGGGHEEGHHGGVWKIAFADFMTAMMAFFLVMWLISANDKTKATIAKYFNPIELIDSTPQPVGLNDAKKDDPNVERKSQTPGRDAQDKEAKPAEKSPPAPASAPAPAGAAPKPIDVAPIDEADQSAKHDEAELIHDPYAVIAEIASKATAEPPKQSPPPTVGPPVSGTGAVGLKNGEAFRDPFEPQPLAAGSVVLASPEVPPAPGPSPVPAAAAANAKAAPVTPAPDGAPPPVPAPSDAGSAVPAKPAAAPLPPAAPDTLAADHAADHADDKPLPPAVLRARLAALAKTVGEANGAGAPRIEVRHAEEGTLISLTDSAAFAMFGSASARPSARTVALMETIGRLLRSQKGGITVRGFTDSRPFRSDTYDNWRLSTERAHIAQYMLLRGGVDGARIDRIEGYADRRPKNAKDPEAPENRRIEILVRDTAP